jgi:hypothetical protein
MEGKEVTGPTTALHQRPIMRLLQLFPNNCLFQRWEEP